MKKETKIKILDILSIAFCVMFFVTIFTGNFLGDCLGQWIIYFITLGIGVCFIIFLSVFSKKERFLYGLLVPFVAPFFESLYYLIYFRKKLLKRKI